jgi:hypothetical protein
MDALDIKQQPQCRPQLPEPLLNQGRLHISKKKHTHGEDGNVMDSICTAIGRLGNLFDSRQNRSRDGPCSFSIMPTPATLWFDVAAYFPRSKETTGVQDSASSSQGNGRFVRFNAEEDQSKVICIMPRCGRPRAALMVATLMHEQAAQEGSSTSPSRHGESAPTAKKPQSPELRHVRRCVCVHSSVRECVTVVMGISPEVRLERR